MKANVEEQKSRGEGRPTREGYRLWQRRSVDRSQVGWALGDLVAFVMQLPTRLILLHALVLPVSMYCRLVTAIVLPVGPLLSMKSQMRRGSISGTAGIAALSVAALNSGSAALIPGSSLPFPCAVCPHRSFARHCCVATASNNCIADGLLVQDLIACNIRIGSLSGNLQRIRRRIECQGENEALLGLVHQGNSRPCGDCTTVV